MSGFAITSSKGFHVTLGNGYTLSVQFGGGNYCENRDLAIGSAKNVRTLRSATAEIAIWPADGDMIDLGGDTVAGWVTPGTVATVLALLNTEHPDLDAIRSAVSAATRAEA